MDKKALLEYALFARKELEIQIALSLNKIGIYSDHNSFAKIVGDRTIIEGISESYPKRVYELRKKIIGECLNESKFETVVEEFAYTWFNRIIAIRFMEVHDYFTHGFRVLTSKDGSYEPEILKNLQYVVTELGLDVDVIQSLKDQNKIEELYRYVLVKQCNALNRIFPDLFDKQDSYLEFLLPNNLLGQDSVIKKITMIPEEDFMNDVEVVGWLYQFYNSVKKDEVFASKETITKDTLPAVTQLFTPDWIVRYMADNSVGRLWLESYPNSSIKNELKYYVEDAEQEPETQKRLDEIKYRNVNPEEIRIIEPCCGSGHILVYVFDLIYKMYLEKGYNSKDIPSLILKNNLYGLDVDKRAAQLANFSLVMKARSIDNRFFNENRFVMPQVYEIKDSQVLFASNYEQAMDTLHFSKTSIELAKYLCSTFSNGKVIGSLLKVENKDYSILEREIEKCLEGQYPGLFEQNFYHFGIPNLQQLITLANVLSSKYDVMITNPPYIGLNNLEECCKAYANKHYKNSKTDMFAMFMETTFPREHGFKAIINMQSWMFLQSFEKLRKSLINKSSIITLLHLGAHAFDTIGGEVVQTVAFVLRESTIGIKGKYLRVVNEQSSYEKENKLIRDISSNSFYVKLMDSFTKVPSSAILYWLHPSLLKLFDIKRMSDFATVITGMTTGDNNKYLRFWYEVNFNNLALNYSKMGTVPLGHKYWIPYNKGGERRNWYGNNYYVVNWSKKNEFNRPKTTLQNLYLLEGITWPFITSGSFSARYFPQGYLWDVAGSPCFFKTHSDLLFALSVMCSKVSDSILKIVNPSVNIQAVDIEKLPIDSNFPFRLRLEELAQENIDLAKRNWDQNEYSYDFSKFYLINGKSRISEEYNSYISNIENDIERCKNNEEEINKLLLDYYNLNDFLDYHVNRSDITLTIASRSEAVKSLISYIIGLIMGRYSLKSNYQIYAGQKDINVDSSADDDGIVPIFRFVGIDAGLTTEICKYVKQIYGETYFKENLDYIAEGLDRHNDEGPEETINRYLNEDFYNDHLKIYQKRPIYWMLNSGKNGAFKCLIYMHRYTKNTLAVINSKYFLPRTAMYKTEYERIDSKLKMATDNKQRKELEKQRDSIYACQQELLEYGQVLDHMANQYMDINLDDGVKANYCKFQGISLEVNGATIKKDLLVPFGLEDKKK